MPIAGEFAKKAGEICRNLRFGEPLAKHTSMKVGGPCALMLLPSSEDELLALLRLAASAGVNMFVMGNGTNLVFSDTGFDGAVIKTCGLSQISEEGEVLSCGCGALLSKAAAAAARLSLTGFEFAAGIPGTIGGAVCMNAGAYGGEMAAVTVKTICADRQGNLRELVGGQNEFSYRKSFYSSNPEFTVIRAEIKLKKGERGEILAKMRELSERRRASQPLDMPSAGSAFKRPAGGYAARLIEEAGLKGFAIGGAQVSVKHSGFIVNTGGATAEDIKRLVEYIRERVYKSSGISLEPEIRFV